MIECLQRYLLNSSSEQKIFTIAESVSSCVEPIAEFGDKALQASYDPWSSVDFHGRVEIQSDLTKTYKAVRTAANDEADADVTLSTGNPKKLLPQQKHPAPRPPRIDFCKTSKVVVAKVSTAKLHSSRSGASGDSSSFAVYVLL